MEMNESRKQFFEALQRYVWSGFYNADQVFEMIVENCEVDLEEPLLRLMVSKMFKAKSADQTVWPEETDCDVLDQAFAYLDSQGIIALHNAGYTMSDGLDDVDEVFEERGRSHVKGYCFYHWQDVEAAIAGGGLWIAFGGLNEDSMQKMTVGNLVKDVLETHGFVVEWNGDPETRLYIPNFDWKRRRSSR